MQHIKSILEEIKDHCKESGYPVKNLYNGTMSKKPVIVIVFKPGEVDDSIFETSPNHSSATKGGDE
ncbi:MAG: hypothetical protein PHT07_23080 [Paludibacter sp.]|nr:hypothetical protein [Paludibacter sp.]